MNQERLLTIIIAPHVSEKSTVSAELHNQIVFKVRKDAAKREIIKAIKLLFDVDVIKINTLNVKGKSKRHGRYLGVKSDWKKAYVTLGKGHDIDFGQA